jgi:uncharacterized protein (DUF433 family)
MAPAGQFTAAVAAFVLREPIGAVKKALDAGPVRPVLVRRAGLSVRAIGWSDLFYLYAVRVLRGELTPKARTAFYEALQQTPAEACEEVCFGRFRISVSDLVEEIRRRTADLAELADKVEFRADGEPVLKGTEVEVYRVAALLDGGAPIKRVSEGYPSLSREDVETAQTYAATHPKPGRPYPRTSVKQAPQGAGLEALGGA